MTWRNGWPVIGADPDGDGRGEPVQVHAKPRLARQPIAVPQFGDEFDTAPNMAWQWNSNPMEDWIDAGAPKGVLRLKSISSSANLYEAGNLLTQKLAGYAFAATAKLTFAPRAVGERTGLLMFGYNYGWIGLEKYVDAVRLVQVTRMKANTYAPENVTVGPPVAVGVVYLRLTAAPIVTPETAPMDGAQPWPSLTRGKHARVSFSYSLDGVHFTGLGTPFGSHQGRWVGAQLGLFAQAPMGTPSSTATTVGYADYDWFRVTKH
jgi:beta-xylosidase